MYAWSSDIFVNSATDKLERSNGKKPFDVRAHELRPLLQPNQINYQTKQMGRTPKGLVANDCQLIP